VFHYFKKFRGFLEFVIMFSGYDKRIIVYNKAHHSASNLEFYCMHNPEKTLEKIKKELEKLK